MSQHWTGLDTTQDVLCVASHEHTTPPTVPQLVHQRLRDQQLDLELARRQQEVRGRLEYFNTMGEAQAGAEQAERSRLQRKRQQLEVAHKAELEQVWGGLGLPAVCMSHRATQVVVPYVAGEVQRCLA